MIQIMFPMMNVLVNWFSNSIGAAIWGFFAPFWQPIFIAIIIVAYEMLVRLDITGSLKTFTAIVGSAFGNKGGAIANIFPSTTKDSDTQARLFKMDTPFHTIINMNRGILYLGFIISFMTTPLFPTAASALSTSSLTLLYSVINGLVLYLEPMVVVILISLVIIDFLSDLLVLVGNFIRG